MASETSLTKFHWILGGEKSVCNSNRKYWTLCIFKQSNNLKTKEMCSGISNHIFTSDKSSKDHTIYPSELNSGHYCQIIVMRSCTLVLTRSLYCFIYFYLSIIYYLFIRYANTTRLCHRIYWTSPEYKLWCYEKTTYGIIHFTFLCSVSWCV